MKYLADYLKAHEHEPMQSESEWLSGRPPSRTQIR